MTNLNKYRNIVIFIITIGLVIQSGYLYYIKLYDRATFNLVASLCLIIIYKENKQHDS